MKGGTRKAREDRKPSEMDPDHGPGPPTLALAIARETHSLELHSNSTLLPVSLPPSFFTFCLFPPSRHRHFKPMRSGLRSKLKGFEFIISLKNNNNNSPASPFPLSLTSFPLPIYKHSLPAYMLLGTGQWQNELSQSFLYRGKEIISNVQNHFRYQGVRG